MALPPHTIASLEWLPRRIQDRLETSSGTCYKAQGRARAPLAGSANIAARAASALWWQNNAHNQDVRKRLGFVKALAALLFLVAAPAPAFRGRQRRGR